MQVSGTAFKDLTNATTQRHWQASALSQKGWTEAAAGRRVLAGHTSEEMLTADKSACSSLAGSLTKEKSADAQRQSRRLHRKRVAKIVVDQWRWFTKERLKMYPAIRLHNHRLLLSALLALQRHSAHRQLEWRRAAIFNHRRQYLIQGKCLLLWHARLDYSKTVQLRLDAAHMTRHRRQRLNCLTAWKEHKFHKAERRKQHLQANFYRSFVLLSSALQQWKAWAGVSAAQKAKRAKALTFWAGRQYAKALSSWQLGTQLSQHSHLMKEQAGNMHRRKLTANVLWHWQAASSDIQDARQAGSEALQVVASCFGIALRASLICTGCAVHKLRICVPQMVARQLQTASFRQLLRDWNAGGKALHVWRQLKAHACSLSKQALLRRALTGYLSCLCLISPMYFLHRCKHAMCDQQTL